MPAAILQANKVIGGAEQAGPRNFYVSWVPSGLGGDKAAPAKCASLFAEQLGAYVDDMRGRPIKQVVASGAGQQQAGTLVVAGGDSDWTDFVALVSSAYAKANIPPSGEFAQVLRLLDEAHGASERAAWTAVIEPCLWRHFTLGGYKLGQVDFCHFLTEDKEIATNPAASRVRDVAKAVERLLEHDPATCPHCRRD